MTYGLRTMWTKRALGNISSSVLIRQVCWGVFEHDPPRLPHRQTPQEPHQSRLPPLAGRGRIARKSRYSGYAGGRLGNNSVR